MHIVLDPELDRMIEEARCLPILRRAVLVVSILETLGEHPDPRAELPPRPEESTPERATSSGSEPLLHEGAR